MNDYDDTRNLIVEPLQDAVPTYVAFMLAGMLVLIVIVMWGWNWIASKLQIDPEIASATEENLEIWTPNGTLSTTIMVLGCMIPSFLVLGGIQYEFQTAMRVVTIFPVAILIIGGTQTYFNYKRHRVQYYRAKRTGDFHRLAFYEAYLRKFEVHTIFADPDEPLSRIFLIGSSQIILLALYVWGLWDRGRPNFSIPRLYAYYYAGIFMLVSYVAGKLAAQKERNVKTFANKWRTFIRNGGQSPKREIINRPSGFFNSSSFWSFYFLGVEVYGNDYSYASDGEITMATLVMRYFLDVLVNSVGLYYIMVGLPIMVSHDKGPIDFVLTAVAAFYILEMDKVTEHRTINIPNFDKAQKSIDNSENDELISIMKDLPLEMRKRLLDALKS
jgi:hypothetical protein